VVVPPAEVSPPEGLAPADVTPAVLVVLPALIVPPVAVMPLVAVELALLVVPPCPDEPPVAAGAGVSWEQLEANATARTKDRPMAATCTFFMIESLRDQPCSR
jgi:hypothetical protein